MLVAIESYGPKFCFVFFCYFFLFFHQTYRLSVRTITTQGEESSDRSAVVTIGKGQQYAKV